MRILHLYRPRVPSLRAQAIQVVHTCEALARRGHSVTILADSSGVPDATVAMGAYGLSLPPTLDLRIAPTQWPPGAGWWFRLQVARWCREPGMVYARAKRYISLIPERIPLVVEAHEVDSELERERGLDPTATRALERQVFERAVGVVSNCEGTMELLERTQTLPKHRRVIHNATRQDRQVQRRPATEVLVGYTGSPREYKGLDRVFESLPFWPEGARLELVGGSPERVPSGVVAHPSVPYGELPTFLARYHVLLLSLEDNLFGRQLTSPLKLWDYLATGIPIVAADLPTTRAIGGEILHYYQPSDPASLGDALRRALAAGTSPVRLRTWDQRAAEIETFIRECT